MAAAAGVALSVLAAVPAAAARAAPGGSDAAATSANTAAVAIAAAVVLALLVLAAVVAVCAGSKTDASTGAASDASTPPKKWQPRQTPVGGVMPAARPAAAALPTPIPLEDAGPSYEDSVYTMTVRPMMPSDVGLRTRMDIIGYQMDTFGAANKDVLREYRIIERPGSRVKGGQAIAQVILHPTTRREFIMKAFGAPTSFHEEAAMYSDASHPLQRFLPEARAVVRNTDGAFVDARGTKMPPCIIMLKGLSMRQWLQTPDITPEGAKKAILAVAARVAELHALGHVHRDLKLTHLLYLPLDANWTLIDFGCSCTDGDEASPAFTLPYAAPETIDAWYDKERPMTITPALDLWSLGVIAIEVATRKPAFAYSLSMQEVTDKITGSYGAQLPWEKEGQKEDILKALGVLAEPVLGLLRREPEQRTPAADFCRSCAELLGLPAPDIGIATESAADKEPRAGAAAVSDL